jgi:hypothetical protein
MGNRLWDLGHSYLKCLKILRNSSIFYVLKAKSNRSEMSGWKNTNKHSDI